MPRKKTKSLQRPVSPDRVYNNQNVQRLINKVMRNGKKTVAERLVYGAIKEVADRAKGDGVEVFETALKNLTPVLEVKSRRVGGANYQIPFEVKGTRRTHLALMWLIEAARNRSGKSFDQRLADEIEAAANESGEAVKRKEDTHRMAEANRAFAHLARY